MSAVAAAPGRTAVITKGALTIGLLGALALLLLCGFFVGSGDYTMGDAWRAVFGSGDATTVEVIRNNRVPRTLLAAVVGLALGVAGTLMQGLTRNPLADPGILGVNAGAYFAMILGAVVFGVGSTTGYVGCALVGAFVAATVVYFVGSRGVAGASPAKLVLTGVAVASLFTGVGFGLTMITPQAFDQIRGWQVGTLDGRNWSELQIMWLPILIAAVATFALIPYLNGLALGDDRARALGVPVTTVRAVGFVLITVLCGASTAAVGPITFVGLMVPHAVRVLFGADNKWLVPMSLFAGAIVLTGSDVLARVLTPSELPVGMITAFLGAPVLIALVRRKGATEL